MNYNETKIRVRYGETDQMGVVYHANYAVYFEVGRTEWLREFGLSYSGMEARWYYVASNFTFCKIQKFSTL